MEIDLLRALPDVLRANLSLLRAKSVAPYKHTKLIRTKIGLSGKCGHGHADMETADMGNADKHVKNSYMVDGLPCNRFCLPEKFHVSLKYWTK